MTQPFTRLTHLLDIAPATPSPICHDSIDVRSQAGGMIESVALKNGNEGSE